MRLTGWRAAVVAVATLIGLGASAGAAGAATAGGGGDHGLRPEFFTIKIVNDNPGVVHAFGPVHGTATDTEDTATTAVFDFGHGNTVNVIHTDVSNVQPGKPDYSCTAFAFATGKWLFDGGTGKYRHAFGFGKFKFFLTVVFQKNHHKCDVKAPPKLVIVKVFGFGKATAGNHK